MDNEGMITTALVMDAFWGRAITVGLATACRVSDGVWDMGDRRWPRGDDVYYYCNIAALRVAAARLRLSSCATVKRPLYYRDPQYEGARQVSSTVSRAILWRPLSTRSQLIPEWLRHCAPYVAVGHSSVDIDEILCLSSVEILA